MVCAGYEGSTWESLKRDFEREWRSGINVLCVTMSSATLLKLTVEAGWEVSGMPGHKGVRLFGADVVLDNNMPRGDYLLSTNETPSHRPPVASKEAALPATSNIRSIQL